LPRHTSPASSNMRCPWEKAMGPPIIFLIYMPRQD